VSSVTTGVGPGSGPSGGCPSAPVPAGLATFRQLGSFVPTWGLIATKHLELRKRRGLMIAVLLLTLGPPVIILGIRMLFQAINSSTYGPAGSPGVFAFLVNMMAEFCFIIAATLGTSAGTTDLTDGVFRHLVITGRSRLALYLARIPAGLAIVLPLVAVAFTVLCLVTSYDGTPQPTSVNVNGVSIPMQLQETQLRTWIDLHPQQAATAFQSGPAPSVAGVRAAANGDLVSLYSEYSSKEVAYSNPAMNEMVKIGLWLELVTAVGFTAGLGLGSLMGQRTVSTILMIVLEIIVTPVLATHVIPFFLNGQRLVVGLALDQLRPAGLAAGNAQGPGPAGVLSGGRGVLAIPPMPTWAMILVIVGWIVGWSVIGAWKTATRDA